jgi:hypothetical protein
MRRFSSGHSALARACIGISGLQLIVVGFVQPQREFLFAWCMNARPRHRDLPRCNRKSSTEEAEHGWPTGARARVRVASSPDRRRQSVPAPAKWANPSQSRNALGGFVGPSRQRTQPDVATRDRACGLSSRRLRLTPVREHATPGRGATSSCRLRPLLEHPGPSDLPMMSYGWIADQFHAACGSQMARRGWGV